MSEDSILWTPTAKNIAAANITKFAEVNGFMPNDYALLHRWSVSELGDFWSAVWDHCGIIGKKGSTNFVPNDENWMTGARFFPDAELNLAENFLHGDDADIVVIATNEQGDLRELKRGALKARVAQAADGLRRAGVVVGDRVAGIQSNNIDALVALIATLSISATWTSCSPDFGTTAIVERIGQVEPKVLFAQSEYIYGGKVHNIASRLNDVMRAVPSIKTLVLCGEGDVPDQASTHVSAFGSPCEIQYKRVPFDQPAYVLFTSGTTGAPKAIVHRAGGVLLQHAKEHQLHGDVSKGDQLFWYTNTAWMMYHWQTSALAAGAAVILYDGAPILKSSAGELDCTPLWNLADRARMTHFGTSPKYLATLAAENFRPKENYDLTKLRTLLVCGAPTLPHQFDWVYQSIKSDMAFSSISGGTEILGSFLIGSPVHPVRRGQLTVPALGHAVAVLDDRGVPVVGQRGELVCTEPFPSMPLTFWGEGGDQRYFDTYFAERKEIWTHGDIAELTYTGGGYVHGRSDNTLKPGGVRIGISEIYAACERFAEIDDFLVFGATHDGDEEVVLCLKPAQNNALSPRFIKDLRMHIRSTASPRHVPARIHIVSDVPYTINGKRVESAARRIFEGSVVKNLGSIANPYCLEEYKMLTREAAL